MMEELDPGPGLGPSLGSCWSLKLQVTAVNISCFPHGDPERSRVFPQKPQARARLIAGAREALYFSIFFFFFFLLLGSKIGLDGDA